MPDLTKTPPAPALPGRDELTALVELILSEAKTRGASGAEAGASIDSGLSVSVRLGEVETVEFHRDRGLGVSVYFDQRKGSASTSDFSEQAVRETVAAACAIARHTAEDECAGLADPALLATDIPDLDLYHPWNPSTEEAIAMATECEAAARELDPRITNSEGGSLSSHQGMRFYANSNGFLGGYPHSRHSLSCSVIGEHEGAMQRDYWYTVSRRREGLDPAAEVGRTAAERTLRRLGGRRLDTRRCPVLFTPDMAGGLFRSFIGAIRGSALYRKSSFLLDQLDQPVFPDWMRIHEQPHLIGGLGSAPFDNEGVATRARDLVSEGILRSYVLSTYSARKLGLQSTGNAGGVHNLTVDHGDRDQAGLLQDMGTGLLVTELMGQGVNQVTGDYSRGAAGFWVENGELMYPVEEITIAGNLKDIFMNIVAVGSDVDLRGSVHTGSVLIDEMTVAGE